MGNYVSFGIQIIQWSVTIVEIRPIVQHAAQNNEISESAAEIFLHQQSAEDYSATVNFDSINQQENTVEVDIVNSDDDESCASFIDIGYWPVVEVRQSHVDQGAECSICLDSFEVGIKVRQTPCDHLYHDSCLQNWLDQKSTCPLCRENLKDGDDDDNESITSLEQDFTDILGANLETEEFILFDY